MDPKILASVINTSSGRCWASEINNPVPGAVEKSPSNDDYQVRWGRTPSKCTNGEIRPPTLLKYTERLPRRKLWIVLRFCAAIWFSRAPRAVFFLLFPVKYYKIPSPLLKSWRISVCVMYTHVRANRKCLDNSEIPTVHWPGVFFFFSTDHNARSNPRTQSSGHLESLSQSQ